MGFVAQPRPLSGDAFQARAATPSGLSRFASSCQHRIAIAWRKVEDLKLAVFYRVRPRYQFHIVRTGLKPSYYDQDYRYLYACFALLVDYARETTGMLGDGKSFEEHTEEHIRELETTPHLWTGHKEGDPEALKAMQPHIDKNRELLTLYQWWTVERPARRSELDDMPASNRWARLEDELEAQEQAMLVRLTAIRRSLWV